MKNTLKNTTVHISREIWWFNQETGRFDEQLGDFRENQESCQVSDQLLHLLSYPDDAASLLIVQS